LFTVPTPLYCTNYSSAFSEKRHFTQVTTPLFPPQNSFFSHRADLKPDGIICPRAEALQDTMDTVAGTTLYLYYMWELLINEAWRPLPHQKSDRKNGATIRTQANGSDRTVARIGALRMTPRIRREYMRALRHYNTDHHIQRQSCRRVVDIRHGYCIADIVKWK
jgi:hypothetical protein